MDSVKRESMQIEFNRLVNRGVILGIVWILGVGSVIALISGFQANKILKDTDCDIQGSEKVKQCFIIGIGGLFVWVIAIAIILVFRKK